MIHIRNAQTPKYGSDSHYYQFITWVHREVLLAARWTEIAVSADAAWSSNIAASYSDCYVEAGRPTQVRRAGGVFTTPPTNAALTLIDPVNDANCVIANIIGYKADVLYLDPKSLAKPWVPATGLTGRVHVYGQTALLGANAYTVLQSPESTFQVSFVVSSTVNRPLMRAYPLGDWATSRLATSDITWLFGTTERRAIINADISGDLFQLWDWLGYDAGGVSTTCLVLAGGKLLDVAVGDTRPYFIAANATTGGSVTTPTWDWPQWPIYMLGYFNEPAVMLARHAKYFSDATYASGIWAVDRWYQIRSRIARQYPWVVGTDTVAGSFPRGRLPWQAIHDKTPDWSAMNATRSQRAAPGKLVVPCAGMNGCDIDAPVATMG